MNNVSDTGILWYIVSQREVLLFFHKRCFVFEPVKWADASKLCFFPVTTLPFSESLLFHNSFPFPSLRLISCHLLRNWGRDVWEGQDVSEEEGRGDEDQCPELKKLQRQGLE